MSQEQTSSHVIHVRENSASEMDALFKVVDPHAQEQNKSIPFRDRNLPASFFQQPGLSPMGTTVPGERQTCEVSPIPHMRAHSSPATLEQTLSTAPPPMGHQHQRQQSCELLDEPLPAGWGMARTPQGQRYFLNHRLQTTTWQDPRRQSQSPGSPMASSPMQPASPASGSQSPPTPVDITKVAVPPGWERAYTAQGEVYFINHIDRTTSWFHPALPANQQRIGVRQQQSPISQPSSQHPSTQPQQLPPGMCSPASDTGSSPLAAAGPVQLGSTPTAGEQQRMLKLQQIQLQQLQIEHEKEQLAKRQEELSKEMMSLRKVEGTEVGDTSTEMTTVTDPFLGQTGSNTDHSRQESADSGLGGMGTSYSLSRTPDNFLANMEEMDIQDAGSKLGPQGEFSSMDTDAHTMDSEDLVPSLQEDIDSELLKDVETVLSSNKVDSLLTWL